MPKLTAAQIAEEDVDATWEMARKEAERQLHIHQIMNPPEIKIEIVVEIDGVDRYTIH